MSSWKKTGGINYSSKFNTIRVQNAVASSSSVIKEIGEKNTKTANNTQTTMKKKIKCQ